MESKPERFASRSLENSLNGSLFDLAVKGQKVLVVPRAAAVLIIAADVTDSQSQPASQVHRVVSLLRHTQPSACVHPDDRSPSVFFWGIPFHEVGPLGFIRASGKVGC